MNSLVGRNDRRSIASVREIEVLRIAANFGDASDARCTEKARNEILNWVRKRSGGTLPPEAWDFHNFEFFSGGRNSTGIRIVRDEIDLWAVRADDPDKEVPGRIWSTEVVVGTVAGQLPRFSARLLVNTGEDEFRVKPHVPGFVRQISDQCKLSQAGHTFFPESLYVDSDEEADHLVELLATSERSVPVVIFTEPDNFPGKRFYFPGATELARATLGIAHVVILPAKFTWKLTNAFGKFRSVFGGAVRIYWPNFNRDSDPYGHRLFVASELTSTEQKTRCVDWIQYTVAIESVRRARLGSDVLAFASIRNSSLRDRQIRLENEGASETDQLVAAKRRIEALETQMQEENATLEYFASEHDLAEERAKASEEQLRASAFRIRELLGLLTERGGVEDATSVLPNSWGDLVNWCDKNLAGKVILAPLARRSVRKAEFEDVGLVARCLSWLSEDCRSRRIDGGEGSLREELIEDGIRNAHCGSDQFDFDWQGGKYMADWHIKNGGNTRDPKRCLRIYYFWDSSSEQIVVADLPAHRRTAVT